MIGEDGEPQHKTPSAAMLNVIRQRIAEIRTEEKSSPQTSEINAARERLRAKRTGGNV